MGANERLMLFALFAWDWKVSTFSIFYVVSALRNAMVVSGIFVGTTVFCL